MTAQEKTGSHGNVLRFTGALAGGVMTTFGLIAQVLPVGVVGVVLALAFIVLLPRGPMVLAGLASGVALTLAALAVSWLTGGWGCASEVDGWIVEHSCDSGPVAEAP